MPTVTTKIRGTTQIMEGTIKNAQIASDAAIELSKLEKTVICADGSVPFSGHQSMGGKRLTNLADPSDGSDDDNAIIMTYAPQSGDTLVALHFIGSVLV